MMIEKETPEEVISELKKAFKIVDARIHIGTNFRYHTESGEYRTYETLAIFEIKVTFFRLFILRLFNREYRFKLDIYRALDAWMPSTAKLIYLQT